MKRLFLCVLNLVFLLGIYASDSLKIAVISDIHYLVSNIAKPSAALDKYEASTGRHSADLHAVLDKTLHEFETAKANILLVSGDMTNHGERESHLALIKKFNLLREKGIRVFVIPGNHDINIPDAKAFIGEKATSTPSVSAQEFAELYTDFGYGEAFRRDTASLSYVVSLNNATWLLCLDTNRYSEHTTSSISGGRILPQTMAWAIEILQEAKSKNITVLGMMHHGLLEHIPYQATFFSPYIIDNWQRESEILADNGLKVVFTGHFHANDVTQRTTSEGNTIFDVETGSLSQYPFPYRWIILDGKSLHIDTHFIESIPNVPDLQQKYRKIMEEFARRSVDAKLRKMNIPLSDETREALTDLLTRVHVLHARGDETIDAETLNLIESLAQVLGDDEFDIHSFQLDFPPADNKLEIILK